MKESTTYWDGLTRETAGDRRRGKRLNLSFSIEVSGIDRSGATFTERTKTLDISELGCRIETALHLERGDIISIRPLLPDGNQQDDTEPQYFRIMWSTCNAGVRSGTRTVGARKVNDKTLWKVTFPPVKSSTDPPNS